MRTVSVHVIVMWDAQEKNTSRPESICGMPRTARGASYRGGTRNTIYYLIIYTNFDVVYYRHLNSIIKDLDL